MIVGYDISSTYAVEHAGLGYSEGGKPCRIEEILARHGATHARLRLWVDPPCPGSDLRNVLAMARRVTDAGLKFLLDFHYSDYWADPAKQVTPTAWAHYDVVALAQTVHDYTAHVLGALEAQGSAPEIVQIGNEVTNGMLWPQGRLNPRDAHGWDAFTALLKAAITAARHATRRPSAPRIMVHIDRGGDNAGSRQFFDRLLERGVDFDLIGLSYYPWWHGTLPALSENLQDLARRYRRPQVIAETAYPWTLENFDDAPNIVGENTILQTEYPPTVDGQLSFLRHLRGLVQSLPDGLGAGIVYWEPAWLPGVCLGPDTCNGWDNLTLFGPRGEPLPSISWGEA